MAVQGATVQLNVRMDRSLKEEGDAVLSSRGLSPSRIVRLLWKALSSGGDALDRIVSVLEGNDGRAMPSVDVMADETDPVIRGTRLFREACERQGIRIPEGPAPDGFWDEIREEAIADRLAERGII